MRNWRCWFGHDRRDEHGHPQPDWWAFSRPHTFRCVRCGDVRTLYPFSEGGNT